MKAFLTLLFTLTLTLPLTAEAGQMSTYLKGIVIKRTKTLLVIQNSQGTYWVKTRQRPPSHTTKYSAIETGFWIQLRDITRFRPNISEARYNRTRPLAQEVH